MNAMTVSLKGIFYFSLIGIFVFVTAFSISSDMWQNLVKKGWERLEPQVWYCIAYFHVSRFAAHPDARHCFLLPAGGYYGFNDVRPTPRMLFTMLTNGVFNALFQPIFLCVFTPQAILNYLIFPFFLYGAIRYFKKVPLLIVFFIFFSFYIGLKNAVVETLIRHRMSCELIYLTIGSAGFARWITRS